VRTRTAAGSGSPGNKKRDECNKGVRADQPASMPWDII